MLYLFFYGIYIIIVERLILWFMARYDRVSKLLILWVFCSSIEMYMEFLSPVSVVLIVDTSKLYITVFESYTHSFSGYLCESSKFNDKSRREICSIKYWYFWVDNHMSTIQPIYLRFFFGFEGKVGSFVYKCHTNERWFYCLILQTWAWRVLSQWEWGAVHREIQRSHG